tara:strand:+ start:62 stop:247 length:186 start_codon:yes stop_codon:yes gene_type:complete
MKIKLKNKNFNLPNCWKQCGVSKEDWNKLQANGEIDVKTIFVGIEHLVEKTSSSTTKKRNK